MRRFQTWPGKNIFLFRGKVILGPSHSLPNSVGGFLLIVAIGGLFLGFVAVQLHWAVFGVGLALALASMYTQVLTAVTEPGIIPRATSAVPPAGASWALPTFTAVTVGTRTMELKYCASCHIYRPAKSSHCQICDNCVEDLDHHCPWVGTCIGRRNYRYFILFVVSVTTLSIYSTACSIVHVVINARGQAFWESLTHIPATVFVLLISAIFAVALASLCGFHSFLIIIGRTTREQIKRLTPMSSTEHRRIMLFSKMIKSRLPDMSVELDPQNTVWIPIDTREDFIVPAIDVAEKISGKPALPIPSSPHPPLPSPTSTTTSSALPMPSSLPLSSTSTSTASVPHPHRRPPSISASPNRELATQSGLMSPSGIVAVSSYAYGGQLTPKMAGLGSPTASRSVPTLSAETAFSSSQHHHHQLQQWPASSATSQVNTTTNSASTPLSITTPSERRGQVRLAPIPPSSLSSQPPSTFQYSQQPQQYSTSQQQLLGSLSQAGRQQWQVIAPRSGEGGGVSSNPSSQPQPQSQSQPPPPQPYLSRRPSSGNTTPIPWQSISSPEMTPQDNAGERLRASGIGQYSFGGSGVRGVGEYEMAERQYGVVG